MVALLIMIPMSGYAQQASLSTSKAADEERWPNRFTIRSRT